MTKEIRTHLLANMDMSRKNIMISNFLGGLAWGVGSVLGATIVVAIVLKILAGASFVPIIGSTLGEFINTTNQKQEQAQDR